MNTARQFSVEDAEGILKDIVAGIVYQSASIEIERVPFGYNGQRLVCRVDGSETSKVVGKQAKHIKALQLIFLALGQATGNAFRVTLDENKPGVEDYRSRVKGGFSQPVVKDLLSRIVSTLDHAAVVTCREVGSCVCLETTPAQFTSDIREAIKILFSAIGRSYGFVIECEFSD